MSKAAKFVIFVGILNVVKKGVLTSTYKYLQVLTSYATARDMERKLMCDG